MILAFNFADLIQIPFGYLLDGLYRLTSSYGWALILFSIIVKLVLMPATAKSKRSTMKMSRLTPRLQYIQKKYENDQQKQNEAIQALYKEEGVSMGGGCLWSMLPMLVLFPLYAVIRQPIIYMLHESFETTCEIMNAIKGTADVEGLLPGLISANNTYYEQLIAASRLPEIADQLKTLIPEISERTLQGLNFSFLGIDLAAIPQYNIFASDWVWNWEHIGAFLLPVLSAGSQMITMLISQKVNNSLVTNEKGVQDTDAAKNSQTNQTSKVMLYMMPIMTIFIGFGVPAALSLYWLIQGVVSTVSDMYLTKKFRKEYDAEDAIRLQKAMEAELAELEKERVRAERRAANPDGITENTSKKKLQQKQQKEQEAAKAAAKKEYNAKRGIYEEEPEEKQVMSGIPERPYCKGRNYDPYRYASDITEE